MYALSLTLAKGQSHGKRKFESYSTCKPKIPSAVQCVNVLRPGSGFAVLAIF